MYELFEQRKVVESKVPCIVYESRIKVKDNKEKELVRKKKSLEDAKSHQCHY